MIQIFITSLLVSTGFGYTTLRKDFDISKFENLNNNEQLNFPTIDLKKKHLDRTHIIDKELETHTRNFIENHYLENNINDYDDIEIPVVFHIIYNDGNTYNLDDYGLDNLILNENILQTYIINQLNEDFNMENEDINNTPDEWKDILGNFKITFTIKMIKYISSYNEDWDIENGDFDKMKFDKYGGSDVINPELNLNIWVVLFSDLEEGGLLMGYAQFPSEFKNSPETDGFVLNVLSLYLEEDRTSTHEIGHWMNLRHIWGDGGCDDDDFVDDTPSSNTNHIECGSSVNCSYPETSSCGTPDMFMNFMSYGSPVYMFTYDQMLRSRAVFVKGGTRYSIVIQEKSQDDYLVISIIFSIGLIIGLYFIGKSIYNCWLKRNIQHTELIDDSII